MLRYGEYQLDDLEPMDIEEPEVKSVLYTGENDDNLGQSLLEANEGNPVVIHRLKEEQVGGDHYSKHKIQPWCVIDEYKLDYHLGNVIKYVLRDKGNKVEDIKKAKHYLEHWLEING